MIKRSIIISLFLILTFQTGKAYNAGKWNSYLSYYKIQNVEKANDILFVQASNALYAYNTKNKSIQTFSKTDFLNDTEITRISYNRQTRKLLIIYSNGNMDIMDVDNYEVTNLSDYYNVSTTNDKSINDIFQYGKYAYISTGFGIVKVNIDEAEITDTYHLGFNVNWCMIEQNYIYAYSAENGRYRALITDNLLNRSNWKRDGEYTTKTEDNKDSLKAIVGKLNPGGPKYNYFGFMKYHHGKLYTTDGVSHATYDYGKEGTIQVYNDNEWQIYEDSLSQKTGHAYADLASLDIDPKDDNHVFASGRTGLYEFRNGKFVKEYNNYNGSPFKTASTVGNDNRDYVMVQGITFDTEGNLWTLNSISPSTNLIVLKNNQWINLFQKNLMLETNKSYENMINLFEDNEHNLWFCNNHWRKPGVFRYHPYTNQQDLYNDITNQNGEKEHITFINCIAKDLENNIWIGSDIGPFVIYRNDIEQNNSVYSKIIVPRNDDTNLGNYLLSGIEITSIVVDGGGQKWIGTANNGLYLISEDNDTQLEHFTWDNSMLLSNNILSLALSPEGVLYIGTDKGLCSYKTDSSEPNSTMTHETVYAYPNPVRPEYRGNITITGLSYHADIKIVTSNGVLVNQGRSTGGSYVWDGNDQKGRRVASGIYMVQTATSSGDKGTVCKIAIIN
ncbi:type IX secretion system anionic LPS delivery protein PorZ [Segatella albensis]|uniref:type IX secretion system anionic LPS delivery protein PorZ n=1 Tax=Segatella albensis TaxID=77768 RepID=UPI000421548B|nr:hypothetical protein [Segatella albensis]